jgi:hypothetical protein
LKDWNTMSTASWRAGPHAGVELEGQVEVACVVGEVVDDFVAGRIVVRVTGERAAWESVVARGGEKRQRVPARPPHGCWGVAGVKDREPPSLVGEVVAEREPGLATSNDDHFTARLVARLRRATFWYPEH